MSSLQHSALIGLLVDCSLDDKSTHTWEDAASGETTTIEELLTLLTQEEPLVI
jgi:hypothetical protein